MPIYPSDLHIGTDVFSSDGHKLGELHRVVLRLADLSVSEVVIDIGFLRSGHYLWEGGLGLDYDRVVPVDTVHGVSKERIQLSLTAAEFRDAPEYSIEHFEEVQDLTPDEFDIPDVVNRLQGLSAIVSSTANGWLIEKQTRPEGSVEIAEGTSVWRRDPHEKLGEVDHVLFDPNTGGLRAIVMRRGFLLKRDVVLPRRYVAEIVDDIVRVDIGDEELDQLREYRR
jgi:sporulation protein YlmC with PRC-barrel domain